MILTIIKSPLRSRQLLVIWLIFGVGLLPDKTEGQGLKCHSCKGDACKTDAGAECTSGFCEKITEGGTVEMKCSDAAKEAECIKKIFPNGCYTVNDENKEKLTTCMGGGQLGENAQKSGVTICSCNTDLCNKVEFGNGSSISKVKKRSAVDHLAMGEITCYKCEGATNCKNAGTQRCEGACLTSMQDGVIIEKLCNQMVTTQYDCFSKYPEGCVRTKSEAEEFQRCTLQASKEALGLLGFYGRSSSGETKFCACNSNLCNGKGGGGGGGGYGNGDDNGDSMKSIECYICTDKESCAHPQKITCAGACYKGELSSGTMVKTCKVMSQAEFNCYKDYSGGCVRNDRELNAARNCVNKLRYQGREAQELTSASICYCNSNLCNGNDNGNGNNNSVDRPIPRYKLAYFFGVLTQLARLI